MVGCYYLAGDRAIQSKWEPLSMSLEAYKMICLAITIYCMYFAFVKDLEK